MWGACQRVQLDDGADSSLHRNQRGSRSRRLQLQQWLGPVNRTWWSGTELPARPEDFNEDSSWSWFHKPRFSDLLVRVHRGFQLHLQVRVVRSPEHGRDHLHPLHGWIPDVRGVGKVSPLVCLPALAARVGADGASHARQFKILPFYLKRAPDRCFQQFEGGFRPVWVCKRLQVSRSVCRILFPDKTRRIASSVQ